MVAWSGFILPTSQLSSGWHHIAREAYDNNNSVWFLQYQPKPNWLVRNVSEMTYFCVEWDVIYHLSEGNETKLLITVFHFNHSCYYNIYITEFCLINRATGYASQHIWCPSQTRINWEDCGRKSIQHRNGGMMEGWLVQMEWRPFRWSVCLPLLSSLAP